MNIAKIEDATRSGRKAAVAADRAFIKRFVETMSAERIHALARALALTSGHVASEGATSDTGLETAAIAADLASVMQFVETMPAGRVRALARALATAPYSPGPRPVGHLALRLPPGSHGRRPVREKA